MVRRRAQFVPWHSAGTITETGINFDEVVRETGWVFNNKTGDSLTLDSFVKTGDAEVRRYMRQFGFPPERLSTKTLLEIGCGIGRMTASFSNQCVGVVAADVDAAFLERCRETVGLHGRADRLQTSLVADGRSIALPDDSVDLAFSYITLQHCDHEDALALTREAIRVVHNGGTIALNYRLRKGSDVLLVPLGRLVRLLWRIPIAGKRMSTWRWATRLGWQANRLNPDDVFEFLQTNPNVFTSLKDVRVCHSPFHSLTTNATGVTVEVLKRVNASHWWLVANITK
ncbi:MAG: class I SAM-dependent methyltransferase [Ilumatobacteraceae bacterium]